MDNQSNNAFGSELLEKAFDNLNCGVVKINQQQEIIYANQMMSKLAGISTWQGLHLKNLFPDEQNYQIIAEQLTNRFTTKLASEYRIQLTRIKDGTKIPVSITAIPEFDSEGQVIKSLAIVRSLVVEETYKAMHQTIKSSQNGRQMLISIAQEINQIIPFNLFCINLYSHDHQHVCELFCYPSQENLTPKMRWYPMEPEIIRFISQKDNQILDFADLFNQPEWAEWRGHQEVQSLLQQDLRYGLRYPIIREDVTIASVYFYAKGQAFSEEQLEIIENSPLEEAVLLAFHYEEEKDAEFRLQLVKKVLSSSKKLQEVAGILTQEISDQYQCEQVAIFLVDEKEGQLRLLSQSRLEEGFTLPDGYTQPIGEGILGYVYRTKSDVYIDDVNTSLKFKDIYVRGNPSTVSESCFLLCTNQGCLLLDIEDSKANAFSEEERESLRFLLDEISILIENSMQHQLLLEVLKSARDAIISTDSNGRITKVNPATEKLLGYTKQEMEGRLLRKYFKDRDLAQAILQSEQVSNTEVTLQRKDGQYIRVLFSGSSFSKEVGGGKVYIASDLSWMQRLKTLEGLQEIYHEIAVQTKTPLSLAFSWIRQLKRGQAGELAEHLDKILKQLHKVDLTFDRLLLYEREGKSIPFNEVLVDIPQLLESIIDSMPSTEAESIAIECDLFLPPVKGDLYQISFCFETILSYLSRFIPQEGKIQIDVKRDCNYLIIEIKGYSPQIISKKSYDTFSEHILKEIALGESTLKQFIEEDHKGKFYSQQHSGSRVEFGIELPVFEEEQEYA